MAGATAAAAGAAAGVGVGWEVGAAGVVELRRAVLCFDRDPRPVSAVAKGVRDGRPQGSTKSAYLLAPADTRRRQRRPMTPRTATSLPPVQSGTTFELRTKSHKIPPRHTLVLWSLKFDITRWAPIEVHVCTCSLALRVHCADVACRRQSTTPRQSLSRPKVRALRQPPLERSPQHSEVALSRRRVISSRASSRRQPLPALQLPGKLTQNSKRLLWYAHSNVHRSRQVKSKIRCVACLRSKGLQWLLLGSVTRWTFSDRSRPTTLRQAHASTEPRANCCRSWQQ